ncbi:LysR family transcriptional regulator [Salinibacterium sp. SYSU T00001]|uniref:LysR family transcriptional regulator n=1 Tax=Homoserinimonas sedimenticola TaxID=2986805 RepID=UPI0022355A56|nr:LysR family transcriptional regulator [Salinibacterium sedimenticola]MCW4386231.1 LysR family transcriptional regulator [Salinibacterium sedimenticola]
MDIPFHSLRYFSVLAETLHFGNAAARLSISPPSLSQQIRRLESILGAELFDRTSRSVSLTTAGSELVPLARRVVDNHTAIVHWARARQAAAGDSILRIGMVAAGAGDLTSVILATAVQRMPGIRLEMRRLGFLDTRDELVAGTVDVVFAPAPIAHDDRVHFQPLWSERRMLVVPVGHRLAERSSVTIGETAEEIFIGVSGSDAMTLDWWLVDPRPDGSHPRRGPVADSFEGILELVSAGVGVNIAAASAAKHYRRETVRYIPITDIDPTTVMLCSLEEPANAAVHVFEEIVAEIVEQHPNPMDEPSR